MMNNKISKIKKLDDISLEKISAGLSETTNQLLHYDGLIAAMIGFGGTIVSTIVSAVYSSKTQKALANGDIKNAEKYSKIVKDATISAAVFSCLSYLGSATYICTTDNTHTNPTPTETPQNPNNNQNC